MFEQKTNPIRLIGPCPKVEQIIRAASGELSPAEMAPVGEHVAACSSCAETFRIAGGNVDAWRRFAAEAKTPAPAPAFAPATPAGQATASPALHAAPAASLPPTAAPAPARRSRARKFVPIGIAVAAVAIVVALLVPVVRAVSSTYTKTAKKIQAARSSLKAVSGVAGQGGSLLTPSAIQGHLANVGQSMQQLREANAKFRTEVNRPDVLTRSRTTVVALEPPKHGNIAPNKVLKRVQYSGFTLQIPVKESDKTIEVVNSAGSRLWSKPVNPGTPVAFVKFGGGSIAPGIYQLRAVTADGQSASAVYPFQVLN